jgi:hypothetical protein
VKRTTIPLDDTAPASQFHVGWSGWEGAIRWTDSTHATLILGKLPPGVTGLRLRGTPFLYGDSVTEQRIVVRWNGVELLRDVMRAPVDFTIDLPPGSTDGDLNTLRLDLPDATSPQSVGMSPDPRPLGLAVSAIELLGADIPAETAPDLAPAAVR